MKWQIIGGIFLCLCIPQGVSDLINSINGIGENDVSVSACVLAIFVFLPCLCFCFAFKNNKIIKLAKKYQTVLGNIKEGKIHIDTITEYCGMSKQDALAEVNILQEKGVINNINIILEDKKLNDYENEEKDINVKNQDAESKNVEDKCVETNKITDEKKLDDNDIFDIE